MAFKDYSTSAGSNTAIGAINIAEGMARADVNNALRQLMADAAAYRAGLGAEQAAEYGVVGNGVTDDTAALTSAIAAVKGTGKTLYIPGGTYLVSTLVFDGSNYNVVCGQGVLFKQKTGLTGDGLIHPIWKITGSNIRFGDARFQGNISTDAAEYSHAVAVLSAQNITLGNLYGTDIRGDVLYVLGLSASPSNGIVFGNVSGTNIYRNLLSIAGGEVYGNAVINAGPVGYRDIVLEPNSGGTYQAASLVLNYGKIGGMDAVSDDSALMNELAQINYLDCDWSRIAATTPAYPSAPGTNGYALGITRTKMVQIGTLKLRNYKSYPVNLGAATLKSYLKIGKLDFSNCNQTEATFKSIFAEQSGGGCALIEIGHVTGVLYDNTRRLFFLDGSGCKVRVNGGTLTGGIVSANAPGEYTDLTIDASSAAGNLFSGCGGSILRRITFSNAGSATLLAGSTGVTLDNVTGTFSAVVSSTSNTADIINSTINSVAHNNQVLSSDAPVAVASAATVTLPLDRDVVLISGTTAITSITATGANANRRVTLVFQNALTFTDGSNLKLAGNFVTTADDTCTLVCDGTNWYEVARSVN